MHGNFSNAALRVGTSWCKLFPILYAKTTAVSILQRMTLCLHLVMTKSLETVHDLSPGIMIWYCRNGPASSGADVCPRFRCGWKVVRCGSVKNASSIPSHFRSLLALVVPESTLWFVQATHGAIEHTLDCSRCHRRPFLSQNSFPPRVFLKISLDFFVNDKQICLRPLAWL